MGPLRRILESWPQFEAIKERFRLRSLKHVLMGEKDLSRVIRELNQVRSQHYTFTEQGITFGRPVKTVLDIGAYVGHTAVTFLRAFPEATVYCFEPHADSRAHLERRVARWHRRVHIVPMAVADRSQTVPFHRHRQTYASSLLSLQMHERHDDDVVQTDRVRAVALDEWSHQHVDLMKIDVEGAEWEVLQGAKTLLRETENVVVELSPWRKGRQSCSHIAVLTLLYEAGFEWIGCYEDFWLSKDPDVLSWRFEHQPPEAVTVGS